MIKTISNVLFTRELPLRQAYELLVRSSDYFSEEEVQLSLELYDAMAKEGDLSGYYYLGIQNSHLLGFSIFGPVPATVSTFDLYWIVVDNRVRGTGVGHRILLETERLVYGMGGGKIYAETSGREQYASTQGFYERTGFTLEGRLKDYYSRGDDKLIYGKIISCPEE